MELEHEADLLVADAAQSVVRQASDALAIEEEFALVVGVHGAEDVHERALAAAALAHDARILPALHNEVHFLQHLRRYRIVEVLADLAGLDDRIAVAHFPRMISTGSTWLALRAGNQPAMKVVASANMMPMVGYMGL